MVEYKIPRGDKNKQLIASIFYLKSPLKLRRKRFGQPNNNIYCFFQK